MTFAQTWERASVDGSNDAGPPPEGAYELLLKGASAFVSKGGNEIVKLELEVVSAVEQGYEWAELRGFGSQKQANAAKATCHKLGIPTDTIKSLEELDAALKARVGGYFAADVKRNGDYLNTYIDGPTGGGIDAVPVAAQPAAAAAPASQPAFSDDDIPF